MLADLLAILGATSLLAGVYLWLGLPAFLIVLGVLLIYSAVMINRTGEDNEPTNSPDTTAPTE